MTHPRTFRFKQSAAFVVLAASASGAYSAQLADNASVLPAVAVEAEQDKGYAPGISTTATKSSAPLRDIPQTVNVIPEQLIRDQAARSLQDVLRNVPGVGMSNGDGQRDQVTIRGFSAISDQFVDGMRDDALYFRDLSNIERVEVLKGPAAMLYGRGSSGGLINRVTKKPQPGTFGEATISVGSYDLKRISIDANTSATENIAVRLTGAYEDSGSFRDQGFIERSSIAPAASFKLGADTKLLVQGEFAKDKRITDFGIPSFNGRPVDVPRSTYYGSGEARRDDYTETEVSSLTAVFDHRFSDALSLRNATRYYTYELDRNNTLPAGTVDSDTLTVGRSRGDVTRQEDGYFNQTDFTFKNALGGLKQEWLFGVEIGKQNKYQSFINQSNIDSVPLFNPGGAVPPPFSAATLASANPANSVFDVLGVYAQDQISLTPHWKALLGLRYDIFKQATRFEPTQQSLEREDKTISPRAGLVWQPAEFASYYVSYSKSFQPSAESFPLASNNVNNAPEQTRNIEIGTKLDFLQGAFSVTAAAFDLERSDIKTADPANPSTLINVGEQRTRGLELTASGSLPRGWDLSAGYAYLDARITESTSKVNTAQTPVVSIPIEGNRPSLTPVHSASLWLVKQLGRGFSAGGGLNYSADSYASASNAVVIPGYLTADLAAYYRSKRFDAALNLKNVTNEDYIVSAHGSHDNLLTPGAPREIQLSLTYKF